MFAMIKRWTEVLKVNPDYSALAYAGVILLAFGLPALLPTALFHGVLLVYVGLAMLAILVVCGLGVWRQFSQWRGGRRAAG